MRARHRAIARRAGIEQNAATLVILATHRWLREYELSNRPLPDPGVWSVAVPLTLRRPVIQQWNPDDSGALSVTADGVYRVFRYPLLFLTERGMDYAGPTVHRLNLRLN
jgi:hypothetical protein